MYSVVTCALMVTEVTKTTTTTTSEMVRERWQRGVACVCLCVFVDAMISRWSECDDSGDG